jgi:hypothetical protein
VTGLSRQPARWRVAASKCHRLSLFPAGVLSPSYPRQRPAPPRWSAFGSTRLLQAWFSAIEGHIGRITPAGMITLFGGLTPGAIPRNLTAAADGNIWFAEYLVSPFRFRGGVGRITPTGVVLRPSALCATGSEGDSRLQLGQANPHAGLVRANVE